MMLSDVPWTLRKPLLILRKLERLYFESAVRRNERAEAFDRIHGTQTSDIIQMSELPDVSSDKAVVHSQYLAAPVTSVKRIIDSLPVRHQDWTFVDVGSGLGRPTLIASEYPFRKAIGVEYSERLYDIAVRNVGAHARAATQRCPVEFHRADAAEFDYPDGNLLFFMADPFARAVMDRFLDKVEHSLLAHPRGVVIAYYVPSQESAIVARSTFRRLRTETIAKPRLGRRATWALYANPSGADLLRPR